MCEWDPKSPAEDYDLWIKLNQRKARFYNLSEILVGDESSDIVIKAWRNYSKLFENVNVGDMLELHKFQFLSDDYGNCLNVKSYSSLNNLK